MKKCAACGHAPTKYTLEHDPDTGCKGCPFHHVHRWRCGCGAAQDRTLDASDVDEMAPKWCPLDGSVRVEMKT